MHIGIDMETEMRVSARGRATAPDGMPEVGPGLARRSMAVQGRGSPPAVVKWIRHS
jgi:hypothetical protein